MTLVDCDIHPVMLPAEQQRRLSTRWARHLERYGRRAPHVTDLYPRPRNKGMRADSWPEGGVPGSDYDLLRAQLLDEHDVDFGILLCLNAQDSGYDPPGFAADLNRALNDWLVEEWLDRDDAPARVDLRAARPSGPRGRRDRAARGGRAVRAGAVPRRRARSRSARRATGRCTRPRPPHGLPVAFHTGGYTGHRGTGWPSFYLEEHTSYGVVMQMVLTSLVCSGMFAQVPGLKVVLTEGGALWAAALRWRLDEAWTRLRDETPELDRLPSEVIDDHVWYDTQPIEEPDDPAHFMAVVEQARMADRLMFATDYPHWDFDSPAQAMPRGHAEGPAREGDARDGVRPLRPAAGAP